MRPPGLDLDEGVGELGHAAGGLARAVVGGRGGVGKSAHALGQDVARVAGGGVRLGRPEARGAGRVERGLELGERPLDGRHLGGAGGREARGFRAALLRAAEVGREAPLLVLEDGGFLAGALLLLAGGGCLREGLGVLALGGASRGDGLVERRGEAADLQSERRDRGVGRRELRVECLALAGEVLEVAPDREEALAGHVGARGLDDGAAHDDAGLRDDAFARGGWPRARGRRRRSRRRRRRAGRRRAPSRTSAERSSRAMPMTRGSCGLQRERRVFERVDEPRGAELASRARRGARRRAPSRVSRTGASSAAPRAASSAVS